MGEFKVVSDCDYVVKGFDKLRLGAFDFDHRYLKNIDLWKLLKGHTPPALRKVPAHLDARQWVDAQGPHAPDAWLANVLADDAAKHAASKAKLPDWVREDIQNKDQLVVDVQARLGHIQASVIDDLVKKVPKPISKKGTAPTKLELARRCTDHRLQDVNGGLRCTLCKGHRPFGSACFTWLAAQCPGQLGGSSDLRNHAGVAKLLDARGLLSQRAVSMASRIHSSHRIVGGLEVGQPSTWWGCDRCGASYSRQLVHLGRPCKGTPASAGAAYRRELTRSSQRRIASLSLHV